MWNKGANVTTRNPRVRSGLVSAKTADKRSSHAHKHDHCKHEKLKFCAQCNRPHCLDCGTEWIGVSQPYYTLNANSGSTSGTYTIGNTATINSPSATMGQAVGATIARSHTH